MLEGSLPVVESPRFDWRTCQIEGIAEALKSVGHCVLEGVWNPDYIDMLRMRTIQYFDVLDRHVKHHGLESVGDDVAYHYLGGVGGIDSEADDRTLIHEFERTGLPALFRHLHGDFVLGRSERVLRRLTPEFPFRWVGLHTDGQ